MRTIALVLSFYIAFGVVQIPFIQNLMPDYIMEILEEPAEPEYHYLSIVVPDEEFDPQDEMYQDHLLPMDRQKVTEALISYPGMTKETPDDFVFSGDVTDSPIYLYSGDNDQEIVEIEFQVPADRLDSAEEVVGIMVEIASDLPGSKLFDYNQTKIFNPAEAPELINSLQEFDADAQAE